MLLAPPSRRDPVHVLYDHACELTSAAAALRAESRGAAPGEDVDAALRCIDAGLEALADAFEALGAQAARHLEAVERRAPEGERHVGADEAAARFRAVAERLREAAAGVRRERPEVPVPVRPAGSAARRPRRPRRP